MQAHDDLLDHLAWIKGYSGARRFLYRMQLGFRGGLARLLARNGRDVDCDHSCDVLFLKRAAENTIFQRIAERFEPGVTWVEIVAGRPSEWISRRELIADDHGSLRFWLYRARAAYLVHRFNPKVIVTESNGSILSPALRSVAAERRVPVAHLAHSVPTPNYRTFSLVDYDYYIVYGESSYRLLQRQSRIFGDTRFVFAGSCHIQQRLAQDVSPLDNIEASSFVLLGSGPQVELNHETKEIYSNVIRLVSNLPEARLLFKPHPRSNRELWNSLVQGKPKRKFEIIQSLRQAPREAIVFCGYTNAIIDVAALGMVPVLVCKDMEEDYFCYHEFFGTPVFLEKELLNKVNDINNRRAFYLEQLDRFRTFHLSEVGDPLAYVASFLCDLARGNSVQKYVSIESLRGRPTHCA